jgi:N-acetylglutamate synthase
MLETSTGLVVQSLTMDGYEVVLSRLKSVEEIVVRGVDEPMVLKRYLSRKPGTSFVAAQKGRVVGCLLSGHDACTGCLHRLAVLPNRRCGIARALLHDCTLALSGLGIEKSHLDVLDSTVWSGHGAAISYGTRSRVRTMRTPDSATHSWR